MSPISDVDISQKKLAAAVQTVHTEITNIRDLIARNIARRTYLETAPRSQAEVAATIRELVVLRATVWMQKYGQALVLGEFGIASPKIIKADNVALHGMFGSNPLDGFDALCVAHPDDAIAMLEAIVKRSGYVPGPSTHEREAESDRLSLECRDLEAAEEHLIDQASRANLVIDRRPEVIERRASAARDRAIEEDRVANARSRQAAIDAGPRTRTVDPDAVRRMAGKSRYLETGQV